MPRALFTVALFACAVFAPSSISAAAPLEFKSVSVDLPDGDRMFPPGPRSDALNDNCLACHSAGMVLNQPALSTAAWTAEVNKMINAYKAPVDKGEVGAIIDYLSKLRPSD